MTRRRQFGNVRKLPSGRWQARYKIEGGRSIMAPSSFPTKADAARWLAGVETDRAKGTWVDPLAGRTTLAEYAAAWLSGLAKRTREIYDSQLRLHVLPRIDPAVPALGTVAITDLTPALVRQWCAALVTQHSASAAAKAYTRLRQILTAAVSDELIGKNPCRIDRGGVEHHPEQRFATMAELATLAGVVPDRYRAHRSRHGRGAGLDDYVFLSEEGTPLERSNFRQRVWLPVAKAAGLAGLRFHDLRHAAGTLAARTGATTKELMARLGHASPRAAMIYQHAAADRDRRIAEGLDSMAEEAGLRLPEPASDQDPPASTDHRPRR